ncbi:5-oxoprolinase subunit PxpB [Dyella silvae]|uniref:5-oxoprolinase subunit PxpB n=1 Tax=Dyella silvae TaxID=2994424 RepID=UPI002264A792|nr:5-oxoprolinase subunit PxpB [Dyella silvae]
MPSTIDIEPLAEDAWLVRFGDTIDPDINARVHAAAQQLRERMPEIECVPAYASLLVRFDATRWRGDEDALSPQHQYDTLRSMLANIVTTTDASREVVIPVWYGGEAGPDLSVVAGHTRLTPDEVISRHCAVTYRVAMLGFAPGFPYLLGLDPALAMPRRADPRLSVPAGSVAIGGNQTGIYPQALPGGWQLIGRTPSKLFDLHAVSPSLLLPGDRVRFHAIGQDAYEKLMEERG